MVKVKCAFCNAKLPLVLQITNKCKCENMYCDLHKGMEEHKCTAIEKARAEAHANLEKLVEKVIKDKVAYI